MKHLLVRFVLLQIAWFTCVGGAAAGQPMLGVVLVVLITAAELVRSSNVSKKITIFAVAGIGGYIADSLLVIAGVLQFPKAAQLGAPSTLWMTALWVNFAVVLESAPLALRKQPVIAVISGALGGPLAYLAGEFLGALLMPKSWSLFAIAVEWAVAMPALFAMDRRLRSTLSRTKVSA